MMDKVKRWFNAWWPTTLVVAVILYATLNSDPVGADNLPPIPHLDKLIHAIMFGGLFAAITFDRRRGGAGLTTASLIITAAVTIVAGGLDEVLQGAMPNGRASDILDWGADTVGIIVAYFTAPPVINRIFAKQKRQ